MLRLALNTQFILCIENDYLFYTVEIDKIQKVQQLKQNCYFFKKDHYSQYDFIYFICFYKVVVLNFNMLTEEGRYS